MALQHCPEVNIMEADKPQFCHSESPALRGELQDIRSETTERANTHIPDMLDSPTSEDRRAVRRLVRKIDLRLIPILSLLYTWAFLDRGNLGNVNIAGAGKDLDLHVGNRYTIIVMIFFVGYIIIEIPSQVLMRYTSPALWLGSITVAWGAVSIGQGFVQSWVLLAVCRLLLGLFEGGLVPGCMYLLSVWYLRYEIHKRIAGFYSLGIAANGLSGLLAYGIEQMEGADGIRGWRWIFIIEGALTCACGIMAYFVIVDFPHRAAQQGLFGVPPFLTRKEVEIVLARIERDRGDATTERLTFYDIVVLLKDIKIWEFSSFVMLNNIGLYALSYFLPVILRDGFGYSIAHAQVLTFPPYAVSVPWMFIIAWVGDRFRIRGPLIIFNCSLYIIGVSVMGYSADRHSRYAGVFITTSGITGNIPTNWAYMQNNIVGNNKKLLTTAMMTAGGGVGGIIAGVVFRSKDAPGYRPGLLTCIVAQAITILIVAKNFYLFSRDNRRADQEKIVIEGKIGFRYTL